MLYPTVQLAQDFADLLQRESFSPQSGDCENFQDLLRGVNASVIVLARGNQLALIPPLELPQTDACQAGDIRAEIAPFAYRILVWIHGEIGGNRLACFEPDPVVI